MPAVQFHVIDVETKEPILGFNGRPIVFDKPTPANSYAQTAGMIHNRKLKIVKVTNDSDVWKTRERERFRTGYYTQVPWINQPWFKGSIGETEHFVRVSKQNPGMVAYIENAARGALDTATRTRPGTYLKRFYGDRLTADHIRDLATEFSAKFGGDNCLKFAHTGKEIEYVYRHGPTSCMSLTAGKYIGPCHPVRAYEGGDLAVAYLEKKGSIVARCVVWPEKKIYGRRYGDAVRLSKSLEDAGYHNGSLTGAKLARIPFQRQGTEFFVCPYIDNDNPYLIDDGKNLVISAPIMGAMTGHNTCGGVQAQRPVCAECGNSNARNGRWADDPNRYVCNHCWGLLGTTCAGSQRRYRYSRSMVDMAGGYLWGRDHFTTHGFRADGRNWSHTGSQRQCNDCSVYHLPSEAHDHFDLLCRACGEAEKKRKRQRQKEKAQ